MTESLLSPTFLFRFAMPCHYRSPLWTAAAGANGGAAADDAATDGAARGGLEDRYRLLPLAALDERKIFADVRAAWSEQGLAFSVRVEGKRQAPWCRETRIADSDGFCVWIDTRDTHSIHRASRFCHRFMFLPGGGGRRMDEPVADQLLVDRARENARPIRPGALAVRSEKRIDGYILEAHVPAEAMTGFEPFDHPRLGFFYAVFDRELGIQTLTIGTEFPFDGDPSLWGTLELVKE